MPPAARITDMTVCPMVTGLVPHVGGPIITGQFNVIVCGMPQARITDMAQCVGPPATIIRGSPTVIVGNQPASRIGDQTTHGGTIVTGCPTVLIGEVGISAPPVVIPSVMVPEAPNLEAPDGDNAAGSSNAGSTSEQSSQLPQNSAGPKPSGLGADVDALIAKSPTLSRKLAKLQKEGLQIITKSSGGSSANKSNPKKKIIIINIGKPKSATNKGKTAADKVQTLAHEIGHADYQADPLVPHKGKTREQYVNENMNRHLKDEGEATLTNIEVRNEILAAGGPDIKLAGQKANHPKYEKAYQEYLKSKNRDMAREKMGSVYADGEIGSVSKVPYRKIYSKPYEEHYDKIHKNSK